VRFHNYSLILVPDSGRVSRWSIAASTLRLLYLSLAALLVFGIWGAYSTFQTMHADHRYAALQQKYDTDSARYQQEIARLREPIEADRKRMAVLARNIGQAQARLARLDALGSRLVDTASLDESEFNFTEPPAFGGPHLVQSSQLSDTIELNQSLQYLDSHLASVDVQLTAIDYLLEREQSENAARPHGWPSVGGWISSPYGYRADPFTGEKLMHRGVDIANRYGAPVLAVGPGIVVFAGKMRELGYMVEISHGYGYLSRYGHMSQLSVKAGDEVSAGQLLGRIGSSGRSTGPHLHYAVHRFGRHLNPRLFLPHG